MRRERRHPLRVAVHDGPGTTADPDDSRPSAHRRLVGQQLGEPHRPAAAPARRLEDALGPELPVGRGEPRFAGERLGHGGRPQGPAALGPPVGGHQHPPNAHQAHERPELARHQPVLLDQVVGHVQELCGTGVRVPDRLPDGDRPLGQRRRDRLRGEAPAVVREQVTRQHQEAGSGGHGVVGVGHRPVPGGRHLAVGELLVDGATLDQREAGERREQQQRGGRPPHDRSPRGDPAAQSVERRPRETGHGQGQHRGGLVGGAHHLRRADLVAGEGHGLAQRRARREPHGHHDQRADREQAEERRVAPAAREAQAAEGQQRQAEARQHHRRAEEVVRRDPQLGPKPPNPEPR